MRYNRFFLMLLFLAFVTPLMSAWVEPKQEGLIWWEAEAYEKTSFPTSGFIANAAVWAKGTKPYILSQKDSFAILMGQTSNDPKGWWVSYKVNVDVAGKYYLWIRAWPPEGASHFKVRFDKDDWTDVDPGTPKLEVVDTGDNWRQIAWLKVGRYSLSKGEHNFELIITTRNSAAQFIQNFDCFMLCKAPVSPQGTKKPTFELKKEEEEVWE